MNPSGAKPTALRTERLTLRALSAEDLRAAHRVFDDPLVRRRLFDDRPISVETAKSLLGASERDFAAGGGGLFGPRVAGEVDLVGFCGFLWVEGVGEPEMAYGLAPAHWGRGFATEAALAVARYAFEKAGSRRALVATEKANVASLRVIQRLGARPLGRISPGHPEVYYFELAQRDGTERPASARKGQA